MGRVLGPITRPQCIYFLNNSKRDPSPCTGTVEKCCTRATFLFSDLHFASKSGIANGEFQFKDDVESHNDSWVDIDDDDDGESVSSEDSETRRIVEEFHLEVGIKMKSNSISFC